MDFTACAAHDYTGDRLGPKAVLGEVAAFDKLMEDKQSQIAVVDATYNTKFWDYFGGKQGKQGEEDPADRDRIEVNRLKPGLSGYLSALFPRRLESLLERDPLTTGDPAEATLVVNRWLTDPEMQERIMTAGRQGMLFGAAGGKVGVSDEEGHVLGRVWCSVFPVWQLMLDRDAVDVRDQRFIGHLHYKLADEVIADFGLPKDSVKGGRRPDFIANQDVVAKTDTVGDSGSAVEEKWVRVLELCNLVDSIDGDGDASGEKTRYRGRLEIWVLGCGDLSKQPIWVGPMPLTDATGRPVPHIAPLIFEHEAAYPLRPLPYSDQIMPQQKELNYARSYKLAAGRRDARTFAAWKGTLGESKKLIQAGVDGVIAEFEPTNLPAGVPPDLRNMLVPIEHGRVSSNIDDVEAHAESDLRGSLTVSPAALGQVTNATLGEVQIVEAHTESEFGRHAGRRDNWLRVLVSIYLKAVVFAMRCPPWTGAPKVVEPEVDEPEEGAEVEEETEDGPTDGEEVEAKEEPKEDEDKDLVEATTIEEEEPVEEEHGPAPEQTIMLIDLYGREHEITADMLDGDFKIGFTESGRTPAGNAQQKTALVQLQPTYQGLWEAAQQGGPMGVFALEYMGALADHWNLPPNLHPEALKVKAEESAKTEKKTRPKEAPEQAPGPPGEPQGLTPEDVHALQSMPPKQALTVLAKAPFPEVAQAAQQALQSGDPAVMAETVQIIVQSLSGGAPPQPGMPA